MRKMDQGKFQLECRHAVPKVLYETGERISQFSGQFEIHKKLQALSNDKSKTMSQKKIVIDVYNIIY